MWYGGLYAYSPLLLIIFFLHLAIYVLRDPVFLKSVTLVLSGIIHATQDAFYRSVARRRILDCWYHMYYVFRLYLDPSLLVNFESTFLIFQGSSRIQSTCQRRNVLPLSCTVPDIGDRGNL